MDFEKHIESISYDGLRVSQIALRFDLEERPLWEVLQRQQPSLAVKTVGRFAAQESVSAEWALCMALESAHQVKIPERGLFIRAIMAELQRMIWGNKYLFRVFKACGDELRAEKFFIAAEKVTHHMERLTGARVLHQVIRLGGVHRNLSMGEVQRTHDLCREISSTLSEALSQLNEEVFLHDRWMSGLRLSEDFFESLGGSGPLAQSSGLAWDIRNLKPYAPYDRFPVKSYQPPQLQDSTKEPTSGLHWHRVQAVVFQIQQSLELTLELLWKLPAGPVQVTLPSMDWPEREVVSRVEAPSGSFRCTLHQGEVRISSFSTRMTPYLEDLLHGLECEDLPLSFATLGYDFSQGALA